MPLVAIAGVAGGAALGAFLLVLAVFPSDFGMPPPASALQAVEADLQPGVWADVEAVDALYATACADGYDPACAAGDYQGDLAVAGEIFAPMCGWNDPVACVVAGWAYTQLDTAGDRVRATDGLLWSGVEDWDRDHVSPRESEGAEFFQTACDEGIERGCAELGRAYGWGLGVPYDPRRAFELFVAACEAGEPVGCKWAGDAQLKALGGDAEHWFQTACDQGLPDGCRALSNEGDFSDEERTVMLGDACQAGDARACAWYAEWLIEDGLDDQGFAAFERACDAGVGAACDDLAGYVLNGVGMEADRPRAVALNQRACALGDAAGCLHAAYRAMDAEDDDGTLVYLQKSCTHLSAEGCKALGIELVDDEAGARALRAYSRACDLGEGEACNLAGVVLADGLGGATQDWAAGEDWYRRSCDLDWGWGCHNLAQRLDEGAERASLSAKACQLGLAQACPGYEAPAEDEPDVEAGSILGLLGELDDEGVDLGLSPEDLEILLSIGNVGEPHPGGDTGR